MKMSDVFKGMVSVENDPLSEHARFPIFDDRGVVLSAWNERYAKHVAHAINNHDKLVEALDAAMEYALCVDMDLNAPIKQLNAWKRLANTNPMELLKQAKESGND